MQAAYPYPPVQVHLARQPPAYFNRLEVASKRLGQRALHQTLESLLKLLESHGPPEITGPVRPRGIQQASDLVTSTWNGPRTRIPAASPATTVVRSPGRVAELADAQDSGSCVRKDVGVQVPPRPPHRLPRGDPGLGTPTGFAVPAAHGLRTPTAAGSRAGLAGSACTCGFDCPRRVGAVSRAAYGRPGFSWQCSHGLSSADSSRSWGPWLRLSPRLHRIERGEPALPEPSARSDLRPASPPSGSTDP